MRCIDDESRHCVEYVVESFDGENWEQNAESIKHLSDDK